MWLLLAFMVAPMGLLSGQPGFPSDGKVPDRAAAGEFDWSLYRVTRGHFLSATSDDAVLAMLGCEPHSENFGGTVLLSRTSRQWNMLWYKPGIETSQCHKVQLRAAREILVCTGEYGGQGNNSIALYVEDLLRPAPSLMAGRSHFFEINDNTRTCGHGEIPMTPATAQACLNQAFAPPPVKSYRLEFIFNGHDYTLAPSSAEAARIVRATVP
jgi:hypothetical protein